DGAGVSSIPIDVVDLKLVSMMEEQSTVGAASALVFDQGGQSRTDRRVLPSSFTPTDLPPWKRSNSLIPKGNIKRHSGYMEPPFVFIRLWYSDVPFRSIQAGGFLVATSRPSSIRVTD